MTSLNYLNRLLHKALTLYRVEQRKRRFFKWLVLGKGGIDSVGREPADSSDHRSYITRSETQ